MDKDGALSNRLILLHDADCKELSGNCCVLEVDSFDDKIRGIACPENIVDSFKMQHQKLCRIAFWFFDRLGDRGLATRPQ